MYYISDSIKTLSFYKLLQGNFIVEIKKAIKDLATLAIGVLVVDVVFEVTGLALASLNSATANLTSYVSISSLASVITTLIPIVDVVFIIAAIAILLELFGADQIMNLGG